MTTSGVTHHDQMPMTKMSTVPEIPGSVIQGQQTAAANLKPLVNFQMTPCNPIGHGDQPDEGIAADISDQPAQTFMTAAGHRQPATEVD